MGYRWKPSANQRKEFAEKMQDPIQKQIYEENKRAKNTYSDNSRSFKHKSFIPTSSQYENALKFTTIELNGEQSNACNQVIYGYTCQEKIHHDYIHIINEMTRNS